MTGAYLGDLVHYNVIAFENVEVGEAEIEGALAVQGNLSAPIVQGPIVVGSKIKECANKQRGLIDSYFRKPTLLLGGDYFRVKNGSLTIKGGITLPKRSPAKDLLHYTTRGNITEVLPLDIQNIFADLKQSLEPMCNEVSAIRLIQVIREEGFGIYSNINTEAIQLTHHFKEHHEVWKIEKLSLPQLKEDDIVIIYSNAKKVYFNLMGFAYEGQELYLNNLENPVLDRIAAKVVWLFPEATDVNFGGVVLGSIIAPYATSWMAPGVLEGHLITKNIKAQGRFVIRQCTLEWATIYDYILQKAT